MKVLYLVLKETWFNRIAMGFKTVEYREYKSYWIKRIEGKDFTHVSFRCGYTGDALLKEITKIEIEDGKETPLKCYMVYAVYFKDIDG